jgi:hypothetical protein
VFARRLVEDSDVGFSRQQVRVDLQSELGRQSKERKGLDCSVSVRKELRALGLVRTPILKCPKGLVELGAT